MERQPAISPNAKHIIESKEGPWEYRLTLELLAAETQTPVMRWNALSSDFYSLPISRLNRKASLAWLGDKIDELQTIANNITRLAKIGFADAWGAPGCPGNVEKIIFFSSLYGEACSRALQWEENVRFTRLDRIFEEARKLYEGLGGNLILEAQRVPDFLASVLAEDGATGTKSLNLVLDMPEGWNERYAAALDHAKSEYAENPDG